MKQKAVIDTVIIRMNNMFWLSATKFFRFSIELIRTFRRFSERWPYCSNWRVFMHQISQAPMISALGPSPIPNSQNLLRSGELPLHVDEFGRTSIECIGVTPPSNLHHSFLIAQSRLNGFRFIYSLSLGPETSEKIFMFSIAFLRLSELASCHHFTSSWRRCSNASSSTFRNRFVVQKSYARLWLVDGQGAFGQGYASSFCDRSSDKEAAEACVCCDNTDPENYDKTWPDASDGSRAMENCWINSQTDATTTFRALKPRAPRE
jgi:hypothetical protein